MFLKVSHLFAIVLLMFFGQTALAWDQADELLKVELIGVVEAMTESTITVNEQVVNTVTAEISAELFVGAEVRVEGLVDRAGQIVATKITRVREFVASNGAKIVGVVRDVKDKVITIGHFVIDTTTATVDGAIEAGSKVVVYVTATVEGELEARLIKPCDDADVDESVKFTGTLQEVGEGHITVSDQVISTADVNLEASLITGTLVEVELSAEGDVLVAVEVQYGSADEGDDDEGDDQDGDEDDSDNGNDDEDEATGDASICVTVQPSGWVRYEIAYGDTLSAIAARGGATLDALVEANCIPNPGVISAGTVIYVPASVTASSSAGSASDTVHDSIDKADQLTDDALDDVDNLIDEALDAVDGLMGSIGGK